MTRAARPLFAMALFLATPGCGKVREVSACRALSGQVNEALDRIEELARTQTPDRERQMAKLYAELSRDLTPRAAGDTPLAAAVRDYAALLTATETALRAHADALTAKNAARVTETRRELERLVKRERAAVNRIDAECKT